MGVAKERPNIVVLFADDISAREFPVYGSDTWSNDLKGDNTQDVNLRAKTPVMEKMVNDACVINTCWSATVSMPARAQMMTGRYGTHTKWWHNGDQGKYLNSEGKQETWPLYESSQYMMGKVAQMGGYATVWSGKTQMAHTDTNIDKYGFDEGLYTPGDLNKTSDLTDFKMVKIPGEKGKYSIEDSGDVVETYLQASYYWYPSVMAVNTPNNTKKNTMEPWPLTDKEKKSFGVNSYGPDIEQDFIFDFMDRKHKEGKPFFVYHTTHLGHDAFDFLNTGSGSKWPQTPIVEWDGKRYTRKETNITGDKGEYNLNNSLSPAGMHSHVTYLDYVIWRYLEKFKEMGVDKNTVFIIAADNGTSGYGKGSHVSQRGTHVPLIIHAPCLKMTKTGQQPVLANLADIMPTVAELAGVKLPAEYDVSGVSLIPFLTTKKESHRDWIYAYKSNYQMIRGDLVMRDGLGKWYDVSKTPSDLISFPEIKDWNSVSDAHRKQRDELTQTLKQYDLWETAHEGPGGVFTGASKDSVKAKKK